jgi:hypothetical protein
VAARHICRSALQLGAILGPVKRQGLLARWDAHNQRVLERANERERLQRSEFFSFTDRTGRRVTVEVNSAGYPVRSLGDVDLVLLWPRMAIGWLRNRFRYQRGWQVEVLRFRKWGGLEKVVQIERFPTRDEARQRALILANQLGGESRA